MRHVFIINPLAGRKKSLQRLNRALRTFPFAHEVYDTKKAGDAERFAKNAAASGEPVRLYACGGDGTLNEVVNGAAGLPNAAVTHVPTGTGNDFLKLFGKDYRAQFLNLEQLANGPQVSLDLIDCNGRLGIDIVCAGVDARIAADVGKYKKLPLVSGMGAYILSMIEHVLLRGICRPMSYEMGIVCRRNQPTALICICNGRYYGGGFMPVGDALPNDGVLDMLAVGKVSLLQFAWLVGKYAKGQYRQLPELITAYHGQSITFSSDEIITVVVDGEVMTGTDFTVRLSDKKINFFYPVGAVLCGSDPVKPEPVTAGTEK